MELILFVGVAVFAFFVGKSFGSDMSNQEISRIKELVESKIKERIQMSYRDSLNAKSCLEIWHVEYPYPSPLSQPLSLVCTKDLVSLLVLNKASEMAYMYKGSLKKKAIDELFDSTLKEGYENFLVEITDSQSKGNSPTQTTAQSNEYPVYLKYKTIYSQSSIEYLEKYFSENYSD